MIGAYAAPTRWLPTNTSDCEMPMPRVPRAMYQGTSRSAGLNVGSCVQLCRLTDRLQTAAGLCAWQNCLAKRCVVSVIFNRDGHTTTGFGASCSCMLQRRQVRLWV